MPRLQRPRTRASRPPARTRAPCVAGSRVRRGPPSRTSPRAPGAQTPLSAAQAGPIAIPAPSPPAPFPPSAPTACTVTDLVPVDANLAAVNAATLCLVNRERATRGLSALIDQPQLAQAALRHGQDMIARNYFDHQGPAGDTPFSRIRDSGFIPAASTSFEVGENIAWGSGVRATAAEIVAAWIASPEHLANILDANYVYSGISVEPSVPAAVSAGEVGATFTQDFGVTSGP